METIESLQSKISELSINDQALLIEQVIDNINPVDQEAIDRAWTIEIKSRLEAYRKGEMGTVSLEEVKQKFSIE